MKTTENKKSARELLFCTGQVWQMKQGHIQIGLVGKTLVHYKYFKGDLKRAPNSVIAKATLQTYLKTNKAVLSKDHVS